MAHTTILHWHGDTSVWYKTVKDLLSCSGILHLLGVSKPKPVK